MPQYHATGSPAASQTVFCRDRIEELIIRAYVRLAMTPSQTDGLRTLSIAQFGLLEARLTEHAPKAQIPSVPTFWVEIFNHASNSVVDSYGCFEFDEDELNAAVDLVIEASRRQIPAN